MNFLRKNRHILIILLILIIIIITNTHINRYVMGLDNITPFFNSQSILDKTFGNQGGSFFSYFPLLFLLPFFEAMKILHIPLWVINQSYIFSTLCLGVLGAGYLIYRVTQLKYREKSDKLSFLVGSIIYLANLCTFWMFNQPNYFFLAAFASIPWLIEWGISSILNLKNTSLIRPLRIFALFLFLQTTINLILTVTLVFSISAIVFAICTNHQKLTIIIKQILISLITLLVIFLVICQIGLLFAGSKDFVVTKLVSDYSNIRGNVLTQQITEDLQASSILQNTLANNIVFKNSWVETHALDGTRLFQSYGNYSLPLLIIGFIPFTLGITTLFSKKPSTSKQGLYLHLTVVLGLILISSPLVRLAQGVPLLSEALRWSASKFWPMIILPITILATSVLIRLNKTLLTYLVLVLMLIYVFPMLHGNLFSNHLVTNLPDNYLTLNDKLTSEKKYYYLPTPQYLYFYDYSFGYFGSDFISYLTDGDGKSNGVVSYFTNIDSYNSLMKSLTECKLKEIDTQIIWDANISYDNTSAKSCLDKMYNLAYSDGSIFIYE